MFKQFALLLSAIFFAAILRASDSSELVTQNCQNLMGSNVGWTADQVAAWAAANSSSANLLESERSSLSASIDRDDRQQCAQLVLMQHVIDDLVCYERSRSAAQALTVYHQLIGVERQQLLLGDAYVAADQLLRLAEKADELGIKDGNRFELSKQRLQVIDQKLEAVGANTKLRIALGELVGKSYGEVATAQLSIKAHQPTKRGSVNDAILDGVTHRCDIHAIDEMCRSLSMDSLPAMRQLLSSLQPGLGLAVAMVSRKPLLSLLHHDDDSAAELCHRRQQCAKLRAERRSQVEAQIRVAYVERETALARNEIAKQQVDVDDQMVKLSIKAIELEKAMPGADQIAELAKLRSQGRVVELETAIAVADVKLAEATGTIFQ